MRPNFLSGFLPKTGKIPELPDLLKNILEDARSILPPESFTLVDALTDDRDKNLNDLKCQLKTEEQKGQDLQCARGKAELEYQAKLQATRYANRDKELKTKPRIQKFKYPSRGLTGKKDNLDKFRLNQNQLLTNNYNDVITKFNLAANPFRADFDPTNPNSTLGNKALLFDANGRVLLTANSISRDGRAIDESAKLASSKAIRAQASKRRPKTEIKRLSDAIDKVKGTGEINSLAALFAAVTGMAAIAAIVALLVPLSFLTVALNWLQTVTTMLANIKDVSTTYLSIADAGLSLFGYPRTINKIRNTVNSIAYGIFGKKNYEEAKAAFAQGILNLTSMTKLLERIESGRNGTNSKIDAVAFSLGTANNALKEGGIIPPDSEWSQYSKQIDDFVDKQGKISTDTDLQENIEKLTSEIQTNDEIKAQIKSETDAREKIIKQRQKEIDNIQSLGENIKPIIEKQIEEANE